MLNMPTSASVTGLLFCTHLYNRVGVVVTIDLFVNALKLRNQKTVLGYVFCNLGLINIVEYKILKLYYYFNF